MTTVASPSLRWSSVRDCPRKAVFEATDAPARERTLAEERQMFRGRSVGHDFVVALATANRWKVRVDSGPDYWLPPELRLRDGDDPDEVHAVAELKVAWELGTGHADLYVIETDTVVEVLSSQSAGADQIHSKLLQARGYARAIDAQSIALAVVDPATLEEDRIVVTSSSPQWETLSQECDERIAQVLQWRDSGTLPARVCGKPSDAWGHFCAYAAHCFEGWTPDPLAVLDDPQVHELAVRLAHVKAKRREIGSTDKELEAEQKLIQTSLAESVDPGVYQVGRVKLGRSIRSRDSFKLALAKEDSRLPADVLEEFTGVSDYEIWTAEILDQAAEVDYGSSPF